MEPENTTKAGLNEVRESVDDHSGSGAERVTARPAALARGEQRTPPRSAFVEDESPEDGEDSLRDGGDNTVSRADFATWPDRERVRLPDSEADYTSDEQPGSSHLAPRGRYRRRRSSSTEDSVAPPEESRFDREPRQYQAPAVTRPRTASTESVERDDSQSPERRSSPPVPGVRVRWDDDPNRRDRPSPVIINNQTYSDSGSEFGTRGGYEAGRRPRERERYSITGRPRTALDEYEDERRTKQLLEEKLEAERRELERLRRAQSREIPARRSAYSPDEGLDIRLARRRASPPRPAEYYPYENRSRNRSLSPVHVERRRESPSPGYRRDFRPRRSYSPRSPSPVYSPERYRYRSRSRSRSSDRSRYQVRSPSRARARTRSESPVWGRTYVHPVSADTDDDEAPLVETLNLPLKRPGVMNNGRDSVAGAVGVMLEAWHQKQASFSDGCIDTELVVINAAESFTDEGGKSTVTLYCQKDALDGSKPAPHQITWLHVKHTTDVTKAIKALIIRCPLIDTAYKSLALGLLEKVVPLEEDVLRSKDGVTRGTRTIVARVDRGQDADPLSRDSVTYTATPYLVFRERLGGRNGSDTMQSLLSAQYGYDVGDSRDKMQVLSETQRWLGKEILHVARMRSLMLGPEVLLTWGELPLSAIRKNNIVIDESDSRPLITVRIVGFRQKEYYSYVKHDVSLAELTVRITSLTSVEEFDLMEDGYNGGPVTSELWATLLQQAAENLSDIRLSLWHKLPGRSNYVPSHYGPPPSPPRPGVERSKMLGGGYYGSSVDRSKARAYAYDERKTASSEGYVSGSAVAQRQPYPPPGTDRSMYAPASVSLWPPESAAAPIIVRDRRSSYYPVSAPQQSYAAPPGSVVRRPRSRSLSSSRSASPVQSRSGSPSRPATSTVTAVTRYDVVTPYNPFSESASRVHMTSRTHIKSPFPSSATIVEPESRHADPSAIINYPSSHAKASRTYHLSSSDSEDEDERKETPAGPTSSAPVMSKAQRKTNKDLISAANYVRAAREVRQKKGPEVNPGSAAESNTEHEGRPTRGGRHASPLKSSPEGDPVANEKEQERDADDDAIQQKIARKFEETKTPFLMWRVTQGSGDDQKEVGSVSTMIRLLRKIDRSLKEDIVYGKVYCGAYECSMEDICRRHELLIGPGDSDPASKETDTTLDRDGVSTLDMPTVASTGPGDAEVNPAGTQGGLYVNAVEQANGLIGEIFDLSRSILSLFVPLNSDGAGVHTDMKVVMDRYWGALDMVFRHFRFAAAMNAFEGEQSWTVRGSCHDQGATPAEAECGACKGKTVYDLVGALDHLHAARERTNCPPHEIPARPHEDPCIVWLRNVKLIDRDRLFSVLLEDLVAFQMDLERILDLSKELHLFVARPGTEVESDDKHKPSVDKLNTLNGQQKIDSEARNTSGSGEEKGSPHDNSPKETQGSGEPTATLGSDQVSNEKAIQERETPALPASILQAFESLLALLAVQARIVILTMRESQKKKGRQSGRAFKGRRRYLSILADTTMHLEDAREDLILSMTAENTSVVRLGAVGAEYIVALAMTNVQTGAFRVGAGSSKVPLSFAGIGGEVLRGTRRRAVTWTQDLEPAKAATETRDPKAPPPTTSLDVLALYAAHARALDLNATLRPQRRAFLAIRALEEELEALQHLMRTQWHCLENTKRVLHPMSFRVTDRERRARYPLEKKVLDRAKSERVRESDELTAMLHRARDLRARVKESIEVLDEGHGKAIRVFTLVTLFFLPLSFVTSFFGMNTADVRDMSQSSWIYWAIAAPITFSVLCSAYLYAYKWEAMTQHITRKTWLDQGIVTSSDDAPLDRGVSERSALTLKRASYGRDTRSLTMSSYGFRRRDTWGHSRREYV